MDSFTFTRTNPAESEQEALWRERSRKLRADVRERLAAESEGVQAAMQVFTGALMGDIPSAVYLVADAIAQDRIEQLADRIEAATGVRP